MFLKRSVKYFSTKLGMTKSHVWVKYDTDSSSGKLGITNYAQKQIGDVSALELPSIGDNFENNQQMGKIESNDNIFRLYAPFNLKIKKINQELFDDKTIINQSADTAWIAEFST